MTDTFLAMIACELGLVVLLLLMCVGLEIWNSVKIRKVHKNPLEGLMKLEVGGPEGPKKNGNEGHGNYQ